MSLANDSVHSDSEAFCISLTFFSVFLVYLNAPPSFSLPRKRIQLFMLDFESRSKRGDEKAPCTMSEDSPPLWLIACVDSINSCAYMPI